MSEIIHTFSVSAFYDVFDDEPTLTVDELASRLRGWGFDCVDVVEE